MKQKLLTDIELDVHELKYLMDSFIKEPTPTLSELLKRSITRMQGRLEELQQEVDAVQVISPSAVEETAEEEDEVAGSEEDSPVIIQSLESVVVKEDEEGEVTNQDEIDEAKEENRRLASGWLECFDACDETASAGTYEGVHFHWLMSEVSQGEISSIASSGGEEGSTPNAGPTSSASGEDSYVNSGCKQDAEATYNKFIALKYSYTYQESGTRFAVVHSLDGYDEISLTAEFKVAMPEKEKLYTPEMLGFSRTTEAELDGGETVAEAARIFDDVLNNRATPAQKNCVIANSAFAIQVICPEKRISECLEEAREALDSGKALQTFNTFISLNDKLQ